VRAVKDAPDFALRPADSRDAYALWIWANDHDSRKAAFDRPFIEWTEHIAWLRNTLRSPSAHIWIAVSPDDRPVGVLRFDTEDSWATARLSYVIAPETRAEGFGRLLVRKAPAVLAAAHPGADAFAIVAEGNEASLKIFRSLGWHCTGPTNKRFTFTLAASKPAPQA
jgi:RimJ/RimL family protein N-acetyltransferase